MYLLARAPWGRNIMIHATDRLKYPASVKPSRLFQFCYLLSRLLQEGTCLLALLNGSRCQWSREDPCLMHEQWDNYYRGVESNVGGTARTRTFLISVSWRSGLRHSRQAQCTCPSAETRLRYWMASWLLIQFALWHRLRIWHHRSKVIQGQNCCWSSPVMHVNLPSGAITVHWT